MEIDAVSTAYPRPCEPVNDKAESTNKAPFRADSLELQGQIKPNTISPSFGERLAVRLHENPPFGSLSLPLKVCSYLLT